MAQTQAQKQPESNGNKSLTVREETVERVGRRIAAMRNAGEIHFPENYSPENALKSAWLILQETLDKDKRPVLQVCSKVSIYNALLDMVIQGLNPAKKQVYFIAYGKNLICQRSYFGSMALAKRLDPRIDDIVAEVVYEGDEFQYAIERGKKTVLEHVQTLEAVDSGKVVGAYCNIYGKDGKILYTDIMTYKQIQTAWKKSKMNPVQGNGDLKGGSTHAEYLEEMCKKTVITRTCKPIINSSDDKNLVAAAGRSDFVRAESESEETMEEHANQDFLDVEPEPPEKAQTQKEEQAQAQEPEQQEAPPLPQEEAQPGEQQGLEF